MNGLLKQPLIPLLALSPSVMLPCWGVEVRGRIPLDLGGADSHYIFYKSISSLGPRFLRCRFAGPKPGYPEATDVSPGRAQSAVGEKEVLTVFPLHVIFLSTVGLGVRATSWLPMGKLVCQGAPLVAPGMEFGGSGLTSPADLTLGTVSLQIFHLSGGDGRCWLGPAAFLRSEGSAPCQPGGCSCCAAAMRRLGEGCMAVLWTRCLLGVAADLTSEL